MSLLSPSWPVAGYIALAAAAAGFGSGWGVNGWRLGAELATVTAQRDGYGTALDLQNKSVQALADEGKKTRAELAEALTAGAEAQTRAAAAVAARTQKKAPASCDAAMAETDREP